MPDEPPRCPSCDGSKRETVHLRTSTGGRWENRPCSTCDGTGQVSHEHAERIKKGRQIREDRKSRLMTLRAEAARLGISPTELSKIESGRE